MRNGASDTLNRATEKLPTEEVFQLLHAQIDQELSPGLQDDELDRRIRAEAIKSVVLAEEIYSRYDPDQEQEAFAEMQIHEDEGVRSIGYVLECEDYSLLAI